MALTVPAVRLLSQLDKQFFGAYNHRALGLGRENPSVCRPKDSEIKDVSVKKLLWNPVSVFWD